MLQPERTSMGTWRKTNRVIPQSRSVEISPLSLRWCHVSVDCSESVFGMNLLRHPRLLDFPQLRNGVLECICDKSTTLRCEDNVQYTSNKPRQQRYVILSSWMSIDRRICSTGGHCGSSERENLHRHASGAPYWPHNVIAPPPPLLLVSVLKYNDR